jgi:hypothetical protein
LRYENTNYLAPGKPYAVKVIAVINETQYNRST